MAAFPQGVIETRWERQKGLCAACDKQLTWDHRQAGLRGAWQAHHRDAEGRNVKLSNCVILCINWPENCHLEVGHDGNTRDGALGRGSDFIIDRE